MLLLLGVGLASASALEQGLQMDIFDNSAWAGAPTVSQVSMQQRIEFRNECLICFPLFYPVPPVLITP